MKLLYYFLLLFCILPQFPVDGAHELEKNCFSDFHRTVRCASEIFVGSEGHFLVPKNFFLRIKILPIPVPRHVLGTGIAKIAKS